MSNDMKKFKGIMTSGQLIDALKSGATLKRDPYQKGNDQWEYLHSEEDNYYHVSGWGSAFGNANDRLLSIIKNPEQWQVDNISSH